jgi:hypothetical protein
MEVDDRMTYDGGLAEVRITPIDQDKIEIRLGEKHFFDLVRRGKQWVAEYKASKRDAVQANPFELMQKITQQLNEIGIQIS